MKNLSKYISVVILLLSLTGCEAQIKNVKSESLKVYGNCEMCKKTIEKAANESGVVKAEWNVDTKMLALTYDSTKTNQNAILKKVAYAGYDSDAFLAPEKAYNNLPGCCQYDRPKKTAVIENKHEGHTAMNSMETTQNSSILKTVYASYFSLKDALVKNDGKTAAVAATELLKAINAAPMDKMEANQHTAWMKIIADLKTDTKNITATTDIARQRISFASLSKNIYEATKVFKTDTTVYYQYCPMFNKGSNWLSKEEAIKNPYYGSAMLTCGNTVETLK
ncbi:DUF3347 domain-containing protein [Flavobacterium sp. '19STA2R22 D10 B1']|uniref:DUF3347 domain-containing protein n=1 Tax=Flavobacterium aerium TaxID=3037261 RepID=UPI00278C6F45|nr:DUF3347 domain-containing protein [Flavobacterium sp. '19STA2R22 D10 B1']